MAFAEAHFSYDLIAQGSSIGFVCRTGYEAAFVNEQHCVRNLLQYMMLWFRSQ